jgi:hypothetical protein
MVLSVSTSSFNEMTGIAYAAGRIQLCHPDTSRRITLKVGIDVARFSAAAPRDVQQMVYWNSDIQLPSPDETLHHIVEAQVRKTPDLLAIDAWDGQLTMQSCMT